MNAADQIYPGLRVYMVFMRRPGGIEIHVYDRELSEDAPTYVIAGNETAIEYLNDLKENQALTLPGMTRQQVDDYVSTKQLPDGYRTEIFIWKNVC